MPIKHRKNKTVLVKAILAKKIATVALSAGLAFAEAQQTRYPVIVGTATAIGILRVQRPYSKAAKALYYSTIEAYCVGLAMTQAKGKQ